MKRKGRTPRFKLQRRLMMELPGLGKPGALERRPYPPGQHGMKRIKYSEHRLQLEEKQKLRIHYALKEKQLVRLVKKAKKAKSQWCGALINLLEKRLDSFLFKGGFAQSIPAASQMISHGKVLVNGKKVNIRSYTLKTTDVVSLTQKSLMHQTYQLAKQQPRLPLPDWIVKSESDTEATLRFADEPTIQDIPFPFNEGLVTSYYSKV